MTDPGHDVPPILAEVRQRRVGKVVVAYIAVAFALVEATATALPVYQLPEWVWRAVLGCAVLGFPMAVVLSWTYDITPGGVVRTPDELSPESETPTSRTWLVLTLVALAGGLWLHFTRH